MSEKTTVSVLGSCVSRDVFGIARPDSYKVEQCVTTLSPMSFMQNPPENGFVLQNDDLKTNKSSAYFIRSLCLDVNKKVFDFMNEKRSDWLVIDLGTVRNPILTFSKHNITVSKGGAYTSNQNKLLKLLGKEYTTKSARHYSSEEWNVCIQRFLDEILKLYRPEQIIFIECYGAFSYLTKDKEIKPLSDLTVKKQLHALQQNVNKIACDDLKNAHIIKMPGAVPADASHKWGFHPLHLVNDYYEYVGRAIDIITSRLPIHQEKQALTVLCNLYTKKIANQYSTNLPPMKATEQKKQKEQKEQKGFQILFQKKHVAELVPFQVREPGANEVVVKVVYSLISSGTEKAYLSGAENTANRFPANVGYSSVGYVVKTGTAVKNLKEGDRVFVGYGGHANYNVKDQQQVIKIPDNVSFEEAVFTRVISFPLAAVRRARIEIGESVVVVGLGMLGLFAVQLARLSGAVPIIAVGNRDIRREKALTYGADHILAPDDPNLTKKIFDITEQKTVMKGANVVIETSGSEAGLIKCLEYTAKNARVMLNGCNRVMTQPVDFYKYVHLRGVSLIGVHGKTRPPFNSAPGNWTARRDNITILRMIADGRLTVKDMISEYVSPKDATEVYQRLLHDREFPLGVIFDWEKFNG